MTVTFKCRGAAGAKRKRAGAAADGDDGASHVESVTEEISFEAIRGRDPEGTTVLSKLLSEPWAGGQVPASVTLEDFGFGAAAARFVAEHFRSGATLVPKGLDGHEAVQVLDYVGFGPVDLQFADRKSEWRFKARLVRRKIADDCAEHVVSRFFEKATDRMIFVVGRANDYSVVTEYNPRANELLHSTAVGDMNITRESLYEILKPDANIYESNTPSEGSADLRQRISELLAEAGLNGEWIRSSYTYGTITTGESFESKVKQLSEGRWWLTVTVLPDEDEDDE